MKALIDRLRNQLTELWNRTERKDRVRFFALVGLALVVIIVAVSLLTQTKYAVLYRGLDPADAGEVLALLQEMGVQTQTQGADTILVPEAQVSSLQMELARQGVSKKGFDYTLFGQGSGFGTTEYEKRMYALFDLQDRLAITLRSNPGVLDAKVQIAVPDNNYYLKQTTPTTASVMLTLDGSMALSEENISAIEYLVANSVPELSPENVFITDQLFHRLNRRDGADLPFSTADNLQMEEMVREDLVSNVMALLVPIFGVDNVRVSGNVVLDFDQHSIEKVEFSPVVDDKGIELSVREIIEKASGTPVSAGAPGTETNGAGTAQYPETTNGTLSDYSKVTREINYDINQTIEKIEQAQGKISDLSFSVAVNVDGLSSENNSAEAVKNLVACAVGLEPSEYDRIAVEFHKFDGVKATADLIAGYQAERDQAELFELIRTLALYALIVLCVLFIVRRVTKLVAPPPPPLVSEEEELALEKIHEIEREAEEYEELVDLATKPLGEEIVVTKSAARQRVEEFTDKNPDLVANLVRGWINEEKKRH